LSLNSLLYGKVTFNEPLALHTSMKVGGPACVLIEPETVKQLCALIKDAGGIGISVFVIGEGCNIIVGSEGIDNICVKLSAPVFREIKFSNTSVKVGAGASLSGLLIAAGEKSLGGYEFLSGIPGTIGGAIFGNAGAHDKTISSLLKEVEIIDPDGKINKIKAKDIKFDYRASDLGSNIIISAIFRFKKSNKNESKALSRTNLIRKINLQDYTAPSAGCVFKNPKGSAFSAGELIERSGLKGKVYGGAVVSGKHANFILNKNNAKSQDIMSLIELIKKKVKSDCGVKLEEEVMVIK